MDHEWMNGKTFDLVAVDNQGLFMDGTGRTGTAKRNVLVPLNGTSGRFIWGHIIMGILYYLTSTRAMGDVRQASDRPEATRRAPGEGWLREAI